MACARRAPPPRLYVHWQLMDDGQDFGYLHSKSSDTFVFIRLLHHCTLGITSSAEHSFKFAITTRGTLPALAESSDTGPFPALRMHVSSRGCSSHLSFSRDLRDKDGPSPTVQVHCLQVLVLLHLILGAR